MYYRKPDGSPLTFTDADQPGGVIRCDGSEPLPSKFRTYANDLVAAGELERSDTPFGKGRKAAPKATPPESIKKTPAPEDPPALDLALPDEVQEGAEVTPYPDVSITALRKEHLPDIDDPAVLNAWLAAEKAGADRKGAKEVIQERLDALSAD